MYIENWAELAREANWSVAMLAKQCGVSVRTLERYVLEKEGRQPKAWLNAKRHQLAMELLRSGYSVKETADFVKYTQASSFSREFTKFWGFSPTNAHKMKAGPNQADAAVA